MIKYLSTIFLTIIFLSTMAFAGVTKKIITEGTGDGIVAGNTVTVHYVGTLENGKEFDSSRKRGEPFTFIIGNGSVIKGWDEGMIGMKVGEKALLTITPDYGYGIAGAGDTIPPNSTLIFEVEILAKQ